MNQRLCNLCENYTHLAAIPANKYCLERIINTPSEKLKCDKFKILDDKRFTIITDTREQNPWFFDKLNNDNFEGLRIVNGALKTGDYSLIGFSNPDEHEKTICIERKSKADLFGTLGNGRDRFNKELERMSKFTYAAIVIEANFADIIINPPEFSKMPPKTIIRSLIAFSQRYGVFIFPCDDRAMAEKMSFIMMKRFYEDRVGIFTKTGIFKPGKLSS